MDFQPTESQELIRQTVRDFAEREIAPHVMTFDESGEFHHEIVKGLAELGMLGLLFPSELGGAEVGYLEYVTVIEELARVDPSVALTVAAHNSLCTNHIYMIGTPEQAARWVPRLASGSTLGAWALTEPHCGSDASGIKTTARRDGDDWIINGTKTFCTNGSVGDICVVVARTSPGKGARGISAFVVEKGTDGFAVGKKENKLGMRSSDTVELVLEEVRVPDSHRLGPEGEGFIQAMKVLDGGRISIAALAVGISQGCLDANLRFVKERHAFGRPIGDFQGIQFKLADMSTMLDASRLLVYRAAAAKDSGATDTGLESSIAKLYASEAASRIADQSVQIHGGYGFVKDYPVEKFYRDVKLTTIGEGTSEIQRMVIARRLLE